MRVQRWMEWKERKMNNGHCALRRHFTYQLIINSWLGIFYRMCCVRSKWLMVRRASLCIHQRSLHRRSTHNFQLTSEGIKKITKLVRCATQAGTVGIYTSTKIHLFVRISISHAIHFVRILSLTVQAHHHEESVPSRYYLHIETFDAWIIRNRVSASFRTNEVSNSQAEIRLNP